MVEALVTVLFSDVSIKVGYTVQEILMKNQINNASYPQ